METISIRLPDTVYETIKDIGSKENITVDQFVTSAVIDKIDASDTDRYIENRALKGEISKFKAVLAKSPKAKPNENDR